MVLFARPSSPTKHLGDQGPSTVTLSGLKDFALTGIGEHAALHNVLDIFFSWTTFSCLLQFLK